VESTTKSGDLSDHVGEPQFQRSEECSDAIPAAVAHEDSSV